jgi:hypothetical protein
MREYAGLKPKMYSHDKEEEEREKSDENDESESDEEEQIHSKAKGVPMSKVKSFTINDYLKTLYTNDKKLLTLIVFGVLIMHYIQQIVINLV